MLLMTSDALVERDSGEQKQLFPCFERLWVLQLCVSDQYVPVSLRCGGVEVNESPDKMLAIHADPLCSAARNHSL
jgi:hypothetical protein